MKQEEKPTLAERLAILNAPIPVEALKPIGGKAGGSLTDINVGYAIHRMNEAFGAGGWEYRSEIVHHDALRPHKLDRNKGEIAEGPTEFLFVVTGKIILPEYEKEVGPMANSHSKSDAADALKGAQTGAFMQCLKYLGFGKEVYMGLYTNAAQKYTGPIPEAPSLQEAIMELEAAQDTNALSMAYVNNALFHNDAEFMEAAQAAKKRVKSQKPQQ